MGGGDSTGTAEEGAVLVAGVEGLVTVGGAVPDVLVRGGDDLPAGRIWTAIA